MSQRLTHVWQCAFCMHFEPDPADLKVHILNEHGIDADDWNKPIGIHSHKWVFLRQQDNGRDVFFCEACLEYRLSDPI